MLRPNIRDVKIALHDLGEICWLMSLIFLIPTVFSVIYAGEYNPLHLMEQVYVFIVPATVMYLLHMVFRRVTSIRETRRKHVIISVALAWLIIPLVGSLPFLLSGTLSPLDSFFESMSGWTTTGMTMIENPEKVREDILFLRSLSQWVGGIGVVALALVVFMREGTVSMEYYAQEVGKQKLKPMVRGTIIETWKIYSMYTIACIVLLIILGVPVFDSINISFATLSTGGFTTHAESIGFYKNPAIEFVVAIFMVVGATSFLIHLRIFEGEYMTLFRNIEFRYMIRILGLSLILVTCFMYLAGGYHDAGDALEIGRSVFFHSVAAITCTGFSIGDISGWIQVPQSVLMLMMYTGGIYGSTAGGIKLLRFIIVLKVLKHSFDKLTLPKSAVLRIGINNRFLEYEEIVHIFGLCGAYLIVALIGGLVITSLGFEELHAFFLSLSAMGNVGLIDVSSVAWFSMSSLCKITLILLMWIGRLEIFPIIILLTSFLRWRGGREKQ
ncbi:MAG: hypothetical protein B6U72_07325 [Candidatus Altiarchaeales archaeon ex4484_2]|nr:MAG: hypothetical protein B6U72_07325 [Candidatus Altiarchaeales archaeon ex4484_2]